MPKLEAFVDGAAVRALIDAVRQRDLPAVEAMLRARPELSRMSADNLHVIHHAVLAFSPDVVRILMAHGADARVGVYPHREATTAYALAAYRGDAAIVRIIEDSEHRRTGVQDNVAVADIDQMFRAIAAGESDRAIQWLSRDSVRLSARQVSSGAGPLHAAAHALDAKLVAWLLERGADPESKTDEGFTPLDLAARRWYRTHRVRFETLARHLLERGAAMTPSAAAALGDTSWLRDRSAAGALQDMKDGSGGLLRIAVTHNRESVLELLLEIGFDPDERVRLGEDDDTPYSWGMALQHAVQLRRYRMAEVLLTHGADPNAQVYASGDPVFSAYSEADTRMIELLRRHGGIPAATTPGLFRQVELARQMLDGTAPYRLDGVGGTTLAEQLLWGAACGGSPEIVRLALPLVDWPRDDRRWFEILEQPLRTWTFGSAAEAWDRSTYLACFQLVLDRCDPNLRGRPTDGGQFGLTTLHNIVARGGMTPDARVACARAVLERGGRLDLRDNLLKSTPLGWACRWGQLSLVRLFLDWGADPVESDGEPWACPEAWAIRMQHDDILAELRARRS